MKYKVSLTTQLKGPQDGLVVIEPEDYTAAELAALKKRRRKGPGVLVRWVGVG